MNTDVQFTIGGDAGEYLKNLKAVRDELKQILAETAANKKAFADSMQAGVAGADAYEKQLKDALKIQMEQKAMIDALTKKMKDLEEASKKAGDGSKVKGLKDQLAEAKKQAEAAAKSIAKIDLNLSDDEANKLAAALDAAANDAEVFAIALEAVKKKLDTLDPKSQEFIDMSAGVEQAEQSLVALADIAAKTEGNTVSLKTQLRGLKEELARMEDAGEDGTDQFREMAIQAGQLEDQIGDTAERIRVLASDTKYLDAGIEAVKGLASGFGLVQGAVALFGDENKIVAETMEKLQAVMVVIQSLQEIQNLLKAQNTLAVVANTGATVTNTAATGAASVAMRIFNSVMKANPIGLVVVAIGALIAGWQLFIGTNDDVEKSIERVNDRLDKQKEKLNDNLSAVDLATKKNKLRAEIAGKSEDELFNIEKQGAQRRLSTVTGVLGQVEAEYAKSRAAITKAEATEKRARENGQFVEVPEALIKQDAELRKRVVEARKKQQEEIDAINILDLERQKDVADQSRDAAKKAADEADKNRKEGSEKSKAAREKALAELEAYNQRVIDLQKQLAAAQIEAMQEGRDKDVAIENNSYQERIAKLKENYGKARGEELRLINANIEQATKNHTANLLAIDLQYYTDAKKAFEDAQAGIDDVLIEGQDREIADTNKKYEELIKAARDAQAELQRQLEAGQGVDGDNAGIAAIEDGITQLKEKQLKERAAINLKYSLKKLEEDKALALAENELIKIDGVNKEELEKIRGENSLRITIDFAKRELAILEASGIEKNKTQIALIKKVIKDREEALGEEEKKPKKDIYDLLGLHLKEEEKQAVLQGLQSLQSSITSIFQTGIEARISAQQRLVDELNNQLDDQQDIVDREKELMENGYANNYVVEEKKLEDLKRRNAEEKEELKQQKIEQAKFAQAQVIIAGTIAAVNLALAATEYFKSGSKFGPIAGTILSLAAIATMIGTFVAVKAKAKEAATFRDGGDFDLTGNRTRHEQGGIDLVDNRTGETVANAEGGEYGYIFQEGQKAKKYKPLLDAINKDELGTMTFADIMELMNKPIGLQMDAGVLQKISGQAQAFQVTKNTMVVANQQPVVDELKQLNERVAIIEERGQKSTQYFDGYRIETEGNRTRKIIDSK